MNRAPRLIEIKDGLVVSTTDIRRAQRHDDGRITLQLLSEPTYIAYGVSDPNGSIWGAIMKSVADGLAT